MEAIVIAYVEINTSHGTWPKCLCFHLYSLDNHHIAFVSTGMNQQRKGDFHIYVQCCNLKYHGYLPFVIGNELPQDPLKSLAKHLCQSITTSNVEQWNNQREFKDYACRDDRCNFIGGWRDIRGCLG